MKRVYPVIPACVRGRCQQRARAAEREQQCSVALPADKIGALSVETLVVPTDVSDPAAVEALAGAAIDRFGALHVVCNNAGVGKATPTAKIPIQRSKRLDSHHRAMDKRDSVRAHRAERLGNVVIRERLARYRLVPLLDRAKSGIAGAEPGLLLTDTLDGDDGVILDGDRGDERPNDQRVGSGNGWHRRGQGRGGPRWCVAR
jgi:hypothetical protein